MFLCQLSRESQDRPGVPVPLTVRRDARFRAETTKREVVARYLEGREEPPG